MLFLTTVPQQRSNNWDFAVLVSSVLKALLHLIASGAAAYNKLLFTDVAATFCCYYTPVIYCNLRQQQCFMGYVGFDAVTFSMLSYVHW